jgi:hypothetical protein
MKALADDTSRSISFVFISFFNVNKLHERCALLERMRKALSPRPPQHHPLCAVSWLTAKVARAFVRLLVAIVMRTLSAAAELLLTADGQMS